MQQFVSLRLPFNFLSAHLNVHIDRIRVQTSDIGGSFGIKITSYPQMAVCALASKKAGGRPVKWVETRSEHMTSSAHGNERTFRDTRVALDKNGVITAIDSRHIDDCGAYPRYEPLGCVIWSQVFPGVYRFKNARIDFCAGGHQQVSGRAQSRLLAHAAPVVSGARGRYLRARARNSRRRDAPAQLHSSGRISLHHAEWLRLRLGQLSEDAARLRKSLIGWDDWKKKQAEARKEGRLIGIGIGTTLDSGTNNFGQSQIVNPRRAVLRQFAGRELQARYLWRGRGRGRFVSAGAGTRDDRGAGRRRCAEYSSRPDHGAHRLRHRTQRAHRIFRNLCQPIRGLGTVGGARRRAKAEGRNEAAGGFRLETKEDDLEFGTGEQGPEIRAKSTGKSINYWGLANIVNVNSAVLPTELYDVTLNCRYIWRAPFKVPDTKKKYGSLTLTYASQLHIAVVEIDRDTFIPRFWIMLRSTIAAR